MRIVTIYLYNTERLMGDSNDATRIYPQVQITSFPYPFTTLKPFGEYINPPNVTTYLCDWHGGHGMEDNIWRVGTV